jgi:hypothetical protein
LPPGPRRSILSNYSGPRCRHRPYRTVWSRRPFGPVVQDGGTTTETRGRRPGAGIALPGTRASVPPPREPSKLPGAGGAAKGCVDWVCSPADSGPARAPRNAGGPRGARSPHPHRARLGAAHLPQAGCAKPAERVEA